MPNFYDCFALFTNQSCKFVAIYQHPPSLSAFSRTNRMILIGILQMQHVSSDFTIWKSSWLQWSLPVASGCLVFIAVPKRKPPPDCSGGGFLQPSAACSNTSSPHRINTRAISKLASRHQNSIKPTPPRQVCSRNTGTIMHCVAQHIPHCAHNRKCIVAARPRFRDSAPAETRRRIPAPRCD